MTVASPGDDGSLYKDPLPYLERFNEELLEHGQEELFVTEIPNAYDLTRSFDFRTWPEVDGMPSRDFQDGVIDVPDSRIRVVGEKDGKLIHACFERIDQPIRSTDIATIMREANDLRPAMWRVTYRIHDWEFCTCENAKLSMISGPGYSELYHEGCGRWRKSKAEGPLDEHVRSLHIAPPDDMYNGYYPTIPGNDKAHHNPDAPGMDAYRNGTPLYGQAQRDNQGNIIEAPQQITGGTEIRGGRAEFREKTKGLIAWDAGTQRDLDRIKKEKAERNKERDRIKVEKKFQLAPRDLMDL